MSTRMYVCESGDHPSTLLSGLNEQRLKGVLCDATVRVQGHLFKAHINVLSSSMGYFRDLFVNSGKEKPNSIVEIPMIVNSTGFAKILDFVYTSQLCLSQSTVMQVLCSACYLQIPYVVEKCQEFITTHGHVTPPSSLSEVTGPFLRGLQYGNFPKLTSGSQSSQSASASLSLLSQLNRLNMKTRRLNQPSSPHAAQQEGDEPQECALINTPPSPADRSLNGVESNRASPSNSDSKDPGNQTATNGVSLKRDREQDSATIDDKNQPASFSPPRENYVAVKSEGEPMPKRFVYNFNPSMLEPAGTDSQVNRDPIDHQSLAEYFSTTNGLKSDAVVPYSYRLNGQQEKKDLAAPDRNKLLALTKTIRRERGLENSFNGAQKGGKERPKKEYRCDYCGKLFGRQQHLKRHILTHTGERPYPCQYCDKRFRRSEHLKHHLANHEQAKGMEPNPIRKKTRKPTRADDAYSLSKMMLDQYDEAKQQRALEYAASISAPVVLPSMFVEPERNGESPQQIVNNSVENDLLAPPNDHYVDGHDQRQESPSSGNDQSPITALNLCRDAPNVSTTATPHQNGSVASDNVDRNSDEEKPAEGDQISSGSRSPSVHAPEILVEDQGNTDIIGMEGSEVLTPDLKRLMAAMNE